MAYFQCPNQYLHPAHVFIMCKKKLGSVSNVLYTSEAVKAYCPYQQHCYRTDSAENTKQALQCYENNKSQSVKTD